MIKPYAEHFIFTISHIFMSLEPESVNLWWVFLIARKKPPKQLFDGYLFDFLKNFWTIKHRCKLYSYFLVLTGSQVSAINAGNIA